MAYSFSKSMDTDDAKPGAKDIASAVSKRSAAAKRKAQMAAEGKRRAAKGK